MKLVDLFSKIEILFQSFQKLLPLKEEFEERLWKKFRLEWNYNSNNLEGNTLTYSHTELLLIFEEVTGNYKFREIEEMKAHDVAIKMISELVKNTERDLSENFIRELNKIILVRPFLKEAITIDGIMTQREIRPGSYKEFPNHVQLQNGEIFRYATPEETSAKMYDLVEFYKKNSDETKMHPVELAAKLHYQFVLIHPFDDGNGRVARLLMNYVLLKNNYPPVIIKSADKKQYLTALHMADTGDITSFIFYIGEQLNWSLEISIKAANGENIDEPGDLEKKILQLKKKLMVNESETVKTFKSLDAILEVFNSSILPLIERIRNRFAEFDNLFKSKNEIIIAENFVLGNSFEENLKRIIKIIENSWDKIKIISYRYQLVDLRGKSKSFKPDTRIDFFFHEHVYEIRSNSFPEIYSKLYGQFLLNEELQNISDKLGNNLIEKIEHQI